MILPFEKLFLPTYTSEDGIEYKSLRLYHVYQNNQWLGHYYHHNRGYSFNYGETEVLINIEQRFLKKAQFFIIDAKTKNSIGHYILVPALNDTFYHFPEVPYSNPYLKIILHNEEYVFKRERPEIEYFLFDKSTWGYYSFALYNTQDNCIVRYDFKIEKPLLDGTIMYNNMLEGTIKLETDCYDLLFSGFFLLEHFFDSKFSAG